MTDKSTMIKNPFKKLNWVTENSEDQGSLDYWHFWRCYYDFWRCYWDLWRFCWDMFLKRVMERYLFSTPIVVFFNGLITKCIISIYHNTKFWKNLTVYTTQNDIRTQESRYKLQDLQFDQKLSFISSITENCRLARRFQLDPNCIYYGWLLCLEGKQNPGQWSCGRFISINFWATNRNILFCVIT